MAYARSTAFFVTICSADFDVVVDAAHYDADLDLEAMAHAPRYASWIVDAFRPYISGNIIEIGAGIGTMSARILPMAAHLDLLEPAEGLAVRLQARFTAEPNVRVLNDTVESHFRNSDTEQYDTAIMINVLEHIEDDIDTLRKIESNLKPGGHLLIYVPAMPALYSALDRSIGHFRRYTKRSLARQITAAGYRLVSIHYMDMLGVVPWYLINTLAGVTKIGTTMTSIYDALGIPVTRAIEKLMEPPVGKNVVAIAVKQ